MMMITNKIIENIVNLEISSLSDKELREYGYDKEKLEHEGSTWIMYYYDCVKDYYQKNKERIDNVVNRILEDAKIKE